MKKLLAIILSIILIIMVCPLGMVTLTVSAATSGTCGDNLTWSYNTTTKTLTISGTGAMNDYSYSSIYNGGDVTTAPWRSYYSSMKTLVINNGVTSIGSSAFSGCIGLTSVTIPDSVTSIGSFAFYKCTGLTSVTIPDSVTSIGIFAFEGCTGLTSITLPDSVSSIGGFAFSYCTGLTSITVEKGNTKYLSSGNCLIETESKTLVLGCKNSIIPSDDSVTSIGDNAFAGCAGLTNITIPDSVTSIGNSAFYKCTGLTSVTIPNSVTSIDHGAFSSCSSLQEITLPFVGDKRHTPDDTYQYPFGYIFGTTSFTGKTTQYYYGSSTSSTTNSNYYIPPKLKKVTITDSEYIPYGAFYNCARLTSVTIGDSAKKIGDSAFEGCTGLESITIGKSVTSIGSSAFYNCSALAKVNYTGTIVDWCNISFGIIASNPLYYAHKFYINDELITNLVIPEPVTKINAYAFEGCTGFTDVTIGNSVTTIGDHAFSYCTGLTSVTIGNSVTSIGECAFYGCTGLTSVTIGDSAKKIGDSAFEGCTGLTSVTIPDSVRSIGVAAFYKCTGLKSITIPDSVTSIGGSAFSGCSGLTSVTIPNSVTSIGYRAFSGCSGLKSITIPDSVTSIGNYAFDNCTGLTSVTIPNSVTSIGRSAFSGCSGLTSVTIPDSVTLIDYYAFYNCISLTSVTIPDSVTSIGGSAFEGCTGLTSITIPNSVIEVGSYAFYGCTGLKSITIPDSVTSIGGSAFQGCTGLTSVTVGNSVTSIGDYAFDNCTGLESITVNSGNTKYASSGNCLIEKASKVLILGCKNSIIPSDGSITSIGNYAFKDCTGLTSITIPNSVTSIDGGAFSGCSSLEEMTIPFVGYQRSANSYVNSYDNWYGAPFGYIFGTSSYSGGIATVQLAPEYDYRISKTFYIPATLKKITITDATGIFDSAFSGCSGLTSITIGNSVKTICDSAFSNCTGLTSITIPNSVTSIGSDAFYGCTGLKDVYYAGDMQQKQKITIGTYNNYLKNATWHYLNFPDVSYTAWYGDAVAYAVGAGLMKGYGSGKFGTADGIQRQDFVVILSRLSGDDLSKYEGKPSFKDVPTNAYYAPALAWAKAVGVSSGYANGKFGVGDKVTREQIVTFLYNYAKLKKYNITVTDEQKAAIRAQYPDFKDISGYAQEAAYWALSRGVISGKSIGGKRLIAPKANAQRCEVAAMFYNIEQKNIFAEE